MKLKKCMKCGAIIRIIEDCNSKKDEIMCCGEKMVDVIPNSTDAAVEKHVPELSVVDNKLVAKVNHVMDEDHFIEWICFKNGDLEKMVYFKPGNTAEARFCKTEGTTVYAYCNKHGLWKKEM